LSAQKVFETVENFQGNNPFPGIATFNTSPREPLERAGDQKSSHETILKKGEGPSLEEGVAAVVFDGLQRHLIPIIF